ncbi:ribonuclease H-like domain-containing protein [Tanacetum coccineum]
MSQPANDEFSQHLSDDEESNHEDASDTGAAPKQQQQVIPQTTAISNIKLPILKKEEYDIWAMEMEHYLEYIDNEVWKVIQNGNSKKRISTGKDGIVRVLSPVTAAEIQAVEKERKAKNILLMAIPKEHMRRFHGMDDAKEIWEAIRTRFGGNANSKKMQKAVFKQQFEAFKISNSEGLEKGYDRFQQLLSQLEAHGAEVSTEDANHKFLRSLPPAWSNLAMTNHACQLGKHVKLPFHSSDSIVTKCFDIIHSDLWTSPIVSSSGFKYYVLFLDHFSHYVWIYPLKHKSDMFGKFLHFRAYVKNQFKSEIKSFQCDHGGEFDNKQLHTLFSNNGIQFRFSCPKTSQQNGKAERMIRTINNVIRTLLFQAHLPPSFWVEALHMATYLLNLLPSTAINNEIPFTKLFQKEPNYSRLRIFGCLCYPHLHSPHKLAPRATPCIFLGFPAYHRGYRCLDLETNKIILSRHVTFDETQFPYKSMTPSSPPSYQFLEPTPYTPLLHHTLLEP